MGNHLWYFLGQQRCQCCMSTAWILTTWYDLHATTTNIVISWESWYYTNCCSIILFLHIGAIALHSLFTESILPTAIYDINCTGSEEQISGCLHNGIDLRTCAFWRDASVICQPLEGNNCILGIVQSPNIDVKVPYWTYLTWSLLCIVLLYM